MQAELSRQHGPVGAPVVARWSAARRRLAGAAAPAGQHGERGTTLLEILVVSVVLLVGILTVIRIFPVGFDIVTRSGYITLANRYCQTWLGELRANPSLLPDGVLPAVYLQNPVNQSRWPINSHVRPTDLEPRTTLAGDEGLRDLRNSVFQFRKIHQLTVRVPRAGYDSGGQQVARVVLPFAPMEYYPQHTPQLTSDYYDMLTVYSLRPYYRVDYDNLGRYAGRDGYYALSPDEDEAATVRTLHFSSVGYPRTFKLDYAVRQEGTANPDVESLTQKIIYVAAGEEQAREFGTGSFVELGDAGGSPRLEFIWGSEVVRRRFRDVEAEASSTDPYWYLLADKTVGLLELAGDTAGQQIGIDYSVMDWQILHDDVDVPLDPDPGQDAVLPDPADQYAWVKLSFPFIIRDINEPIGDGDDPDDPSDSFDPRPAMQQPVFLQNIDPNSPDYGKVIDADGTYGGKRTWTFDDPVRGTDHSQAGRIGLRVARFNQPGAEIRRVRIYYRTLDGFAAQVLKPYATYSNAEYWAANEPRFDRYLLRAVGSEWWLYFTLADVGHSVSVDYTYEDGQALRKVVGEMHTITETRDGTLGYVRLNVPGGGQIRSIDSVRGMSLEVRVVWPTRGEVNRVYDILTTGWSGAAPFFWRDDESGVLQMQRVTAAVAKPLEY